MPYDKETSNKLKEYLFSAILTLKTVDECRAFFDDICTIKEIDEMANRMLGARMLSDNMVYTDISEKTGLSTATISRINRCLKYGSDGYSKVLERLDEAGIEPGIDLRPSSADGEENKDEK